jgi:post-segregation antitoxin (ccd killing protein)
VLGEFVAALIVASTPRLDGGPMLARLGKGGVILLAVFMSLERLGVATDIVTTAFAIIFGAIALALSLSFGLGNRDLAGEITRSWYERWRAEREAIARENASDDYEGPSAPRP